MEPIDTLINQLKGADANLPSDVVRKLVVPPSCVPPSFAETTRPTDYTPGPEEGIILVPLASDLDNYAVYNKWIADKNSCRPRTYTTNMLAAVDLPGFRQQWRGLVCPPGGAPGRELHVIRGEREAIITIPETVTVGDLFNVVITDSQSPALKVGAPSGAPVNVENYTLGADCDTRARLQRKLEQRKQAKQSSSQPPPEPVSQSVELCPVEREKKAAAKREKKKRQKQRKRAEEEAAAAATVEDPVQELEELEPPDRSDLAPEPEPLDARSERVPRIKQAPAVPAIEEAPELDFDFG